MAKKQSPKLDVAALQEDLQRQFRNLDPKDPSLWPALPRYLLCVFIAVGVAAVLWFSLLTDYEEELQAAQDKEAVLKTEYQKNLVKAINLDALKKQREQVQQYVLQLEKQMPSKAEMSALLSDINQAGLGRGLQFELFKPGAVVVKSYYAELPIEVKVSGKYHDIGSFAADVASLSRIVTLNNIFLVPEKSGNLILTTTAKTFRYLDPEEIQGNKKAGS